MYFLNWNACLKKQTQKQTLFYLYVLNWSIMCLPPLNFLLLPWPLFSHPLNLLPSRPFYVLTLYNFITLPEAIMCSLPLTLLASVVFTSPNFVSLPEAVMSSLSLLIKHLNWCPYFWAKVTTLEL